MEYIIYSVIGIVGGYGWYFFMKRGNVVAANTALGALDMAVEMAVGQLEQTVKKKMKEDGSWNEDSQKGLKMRAVNIVDGLLSASSKEAIGAVFGDLGSAVATKIEAQVLKNKS